VKETPLEVSQHFPIALITKYAHYKINQRSIIFQWSHKKPIYGFGHDNNYIYRLGETRVLQFSTKCVFHGLHM
jgi:hypothetical protein